MKQTPVRKGEHWFEMEGDTPFTRLFTKIQREHWVKTGEVLPSMDTIIQLLINDYDQRHSQERTETKTQEDSSSTKKEASKEEGNTGTETGATS